MQFLIFAHSLHIFVFPASSSRIISKNNISTCCYVSTFVHTSGWLYIFIVPFQNILFILESHHCRRMVAIFILTVFEQGSVSWHSPRPLFTWSRPVWSPLITSLRILRAYSSQVPAEFISLVSITFIFKFRRNYLIYLYTEKRW